MLELETFKTVVANAPLISIDLVIKNRLGKILLGLRNNRPAQGYWFVPGGRIRKYESMKEAFSRLISEELGINDPIEQVELLGPYEHFYKDNFSGTDFSTHYVVLGYSLLLDVDLKALPDEQHHDYRWFSIEELLASSEVHQHTKDYFL